MKKRVLVFGVFDLLHPGHLYFLRQAKKYGDELVVIVARDAMVKKIKGRLPYFTEAERLSLISSLAIVTKASLGDSPGRWSMIQKWKPRVVCIGHDQSKDHPGVKAQFSKLKQQPRIIQIKAFHRHRYRSSVLKAKVKSQRSNVLYD